MANQMQLARAWQLYAADNKGKLVNFATSPGIYSLSSNTPWRTDVVGKKLVVNVPRNYSPKEAWVYEVEMGYKQPMPKTAGPLFAYAPNPRIIHCPEDHRFQLPVGMGFGWDSYSAVALLNGEEGGLTNQSQVLHPSERFLWAEAADSRGENVGSWTMEDYGTATNGFRDARFGDAPALFHGDVTPFVFGDGHVEMHHWQESTTLSFARRMALENGTKQSDANKVLVKAQLESIQDQLWIGSHYPGPQNP